MTAFAINLWDADVYGSAEQTGYRWTKYINDPEMGALTHEILDSGSLPPELVEQFGEEDDWLFDGDAVDFLQRVRPKTLVLIYAWHVYESSGGFEWCPYTTARREKLQQRMIEDQRDGVTSACLLTLSVAGYAPTPEATRAITEYFEGDLQDLFEIGAVGHIIDRFNDEPADA